MLRLHLSFLMLWTAACPASLLAQSSAVNRSRPQSAPNSTHALADAQAEFRAGSAAYARGDLRSAHTHFARVVALAPGVGAGHSAYGAVLLAEGNLTEALHELEQAHQLDPQDVHSTIYLAETRFRLRDFAGAAATFELVPRPAPGTPGDLSPDDIVSFAGALTETGDRTGAQAELQAGLSADPRNPVLLDALGALLVQLQNYPDAATHFNEAIAIQPHLAIAHFHLGSLHLLEDKPSEAVTDLSLAASLDPANADYAVALGRALLSNRQDAEALRVLHQAVAAHPSSIDAQYALALALQSAGQPRDALPLFQAVTAARPKDDTALTNEALAYVQVGDAQHAIPLYQQALKAGGNSPTLHEDLGVAHLQLNQLDLAIDEFQKGLALDPADPHLHYDLGLGLKLKDKPDQAINEFAESERLAPDLPDPPYTLGVLYMQLGRFAEASAQFEKAIALNANNGEAWALLGNVYKQADQLPRAKSALARASQLLPNQPGPHISLAAILSQEGDQTGAAAERKIAAELSRVAYAHQRATFSLESGRALLKKGDLPGALVQLQAAAAADPTLPEPHLLMAEVLTRQHRTANAAIERQTATALARQHAP